jgi:hypothetical protein
MSSEGTMQPTLQAVECSVCHQLHRANRGNYVLLVGKIVTPSVQSRPNVHHLGTENDPGVVCNNAECIMAALGLLDPRY